MDYKINDILYLEYDMENKKTKLYLDDKIVFVEKGSCKRILSKWCLLNGSTWDGRIEFFAKSQSIHKKIPVLVSEVNQTIFIPLMGLRNKDSIWINYYKIKSIKNIDNIFTLVYFKNDVTLLVKVNFRCIQRQRARCKRMVKLLNEL